jgi:topoisomerase-4 subunit A
MKPVFLGVEEMLAHQHVQYAGIAENRSCKSALQELQEKWHFSSLEKIFIEKRIYRDPIEESETWESRDQSHSKGLAKYIVHHLLKLKEKNG